MKHPKVSIFSPEPDSENAINLQFEMRKSNEDRFDLDEQLFEIDHGTNLSISAAISINNLGYSVSLKSEGVHVFSCYGFKRSLEAGEPTFMCTTPNGHELQITLGA